MPKNPGKEKEAGLDKAWLKFYKHDFDQALSLFEDRFDQDQNSEALFGRACVYFRTDDFDAALKDLNSLIKADPKDLRALHTRGLLFGAEEKFKEAGRDLQKVTELSPESVEAWCDLGGCYLMQKEHQLANDCFDKSIDIDKSCPDAWFGKGMVALEKKEYKKAIEYLNTALRLDPKYILALLARAEALMLTNQKKDAMQDIRKLHSLKPGLLNPDQEEDDDEKSYDADEDDAIGDDDDFGSFKLDD